MVHNGHQRQDTQWATSDAKDLHRACLSGDRAPAGSPVRAQGAQGATPASSSCLCTAVRPSKPSPTLQLRRGPRSGEVLWAETWARCSLDRHPWAALDPSRLALSCWAITNKRLVGRLSSGLHTGWTWDQIGAYQADLTRGGEYASVVVDGRPTLFYGPGVAPLAVALVWQLHGAVALLEHPGLAALRVQAKPRKAPEPMLALPAHNELDDLLRGL